MEPDDLAVHDLSELRAALVAVDYTTERLRSLLSIGEPVEAVLANTGRYSYFFANRLAVADCESFRTDEPFDRVAFNAPSETAFAFLNSGVDRLLTHDGEVFVWFTHEVTVGLQCRGLLHGIVTHVDGLHQAGGAREVIELHGNLARVICLSCGRTDERARLDERLRAANPRFDPTVVAVNPDVDVELADDALAAFRVVDCELCSGALKPDVVFFGESVPRDRVQECFALVEGARALVVLGSSLSVMSGRRFVLRAARLGLPVAIVNQGPTRADDLATVRVDARLGSALPALCEEAVSDCPR